MIEFINNYAGINDNETENISAKAVSFVVNVDWTGLYT